MAQSARVPRRPAIVIRRRRDCNQLLGAATMHHGTPGAGAGAGALLWDNLRAPPAQIAECLAGGLFWDMAGMTELNNLT
jgi:hypothetical protein